MSDEKIIYAGDHGGCMSCDSLAYELAERGHRPRCYSLYKDEPRRPPEWRAARRREEAAKLREEAARLEAEAADLDAGKEVKSVGY